MSIKKLKFNISLKYFYLKLLYLFSFLKYSKELVCILCLIYISCYIYTYILRIYSPYISHSIIREMRNVKAVL